VPNDDSSPQSYKTCSTSLSVFNVESTSLSVDQRIKLLVKCLIEVFLRSLSTYMDVETCRDMAPHSYCAPGTTEGLVSQAASKLKGRLLSQQDSTVLEQAVQISRAAEEPIKIYDLSRMTDYLRAMKRGIGKTPAVMVNGEKFEGLEAVLHALSAEKWLPKEQSGGTSFQKGQFTGHR
jgi:hypothetical protein